MCKVDTMKYNQYDITMLFSILSELLCFYFQYIQEEEENQKRKRNGEVKEKNYGEINCKTILQIEDI